MLRVITPRWTAQVNTEKEIKHLLAKLLLRRPACGVIQTKGYTLVWCSPYNVQLALRYIPEAKDFIPKHWFRFPKENVFEAHKRRRRRRVSGVRYKKGSRNQRRR